MPIRSAYKRQYLSSYVVSNTDSSRYSKYIRRKQGNCDVLSPSPEQLRKVADQHLALERDLKQAEIEAKSANARVRRLRQQKKLWFEQIICAVSRGIDSIQELERVEKAKADCKAARWAAEVSNSLPCRSFTKNLLGPDFILNQDAAYINIPLDLALLKTLGFTKEMPLTFSSNI